MDETAAPDSASAATGEGLGRRERKKRATRFALKAAALDLVAERGYGNVTVEDIADAVDVSVRTFFNYFPSKEAAVVGDDPELVEAMKADLIALPAEVTPLDAVRTVLVARIRSIGEDIDLSGEDHSVWLQRMAVVKAQPEVLLAYTRHLNVLEHALGEAVLARLGGDDRHRFYAALVTACAIGVMRVAATCGPREEGTAALVESVNTAFEILGSGLDLGSPTVRTGDAMPVPPLAPLAGKAPQS